MVVIKNHDALDYYHYIDTVTVKTQALNATQAGLCDTLDFVVIHHEEFAKMKHNLKNVLTD